MDKTPPEKLLEILKAGQIKFDMIFCSMVLHNLKSEGFEYDEKYENIIEILRTLKGMLASGGYLIVSNPDDSSKLFYEDNFKFERKQGITYSPPSNNIKSTLDELVQLTSSIPGGPKRYCGRATHYWLSKAGFNKIDMRCVMQDTSNSPQAVKKSALFDQLFSWQQGEIDRSFDAGSITVEGKNKLKADYEKKYSRLKSGRINIYQLFFGCGTSLLSPKGILTFIHPKTLLTDAYLSATRKFLLNEFSSFTITNIVSRTDTFSAVIQAVIVSQWQKGADIPCRVLEVKTKNDLKEKDFLSLSKKDIVNERGALLVAGKKEIYDIVKKCNKVKCVRLRFVTGSTEWNKVADHLSGEKHKESKRLIYAENIQRFTFAESKKRINATYISKNAKVPTLSQAAIFVQRTTATEQPYRIIATIIDPATFDVPLVPENHTNVFVCNVPLVSENNTNVFTCKDMDKAYYILGILNSRLMDFYFRLHNSNTHVSSRELNQLPVIDATAKDRFRLVDLVTRRLRGELVDDKIDALVYELYGLTKKEIALIEKG
jgi:hypothetical protein